MNTYEQNRANVPIEALKSYSGQWVAFTIDGTRIVAGAGSIGELEDRLSTAGVDPQQVAFERIDFDDFILGGAELP